MTPSESEHEIRIAALLVAAQSKLRDGKPIDMAALHARYPDLANELPALLETAHALDTAAENWKSGCTLDEFEAATGTHAPASHPAVADEAPPEMIGRYRILSRLGAGGMGTVYKAEDTQLHRAVAVKVPHFNPSRPDKSVAVQRFLREARAAAQVCHPHICPIHDVGEQDGTPFAVMAYVEGTSLADLLKRERLDPTRAVELVRKVALGLEAVHEKGIIHRDLKPGNILLDRAGEPLLTDFGLARPEKDAEHLTQEGAVVGTPAYMAPEQARSETGRIGAWTDIYSLGVVLYQLLTGRLPFEGPPLSILYKIVHEPVPPPSSLQPELAPALEAIVLKAMARRPEHRFQTAREFASALQGWPGRLPVTISHHPVTDNRSPPKTAPKSRSWSQVGMVVAAAVLLLVGGGLLIPQIMIRNRDPQENEKIVEVKLPGSDDKPKSKKETSAVHLLATGAEHTDTVTHLAVSRDGTKVLTHSGDSFLWFFELDAEKGKFTPVWKKKVDRVQDLALHPTGSQALLAIGGNSNLTQVNTLTEEMKDRPRDRVFFPAGGVVFSADGRRYLVAYRHGGFSICDWQGGEVLRTFLDMSSLRVRPAPQLCFSGDGEKILSSGDDNTVRLWNSSTADELKKLPSFSAARKRVIALSPDAKQALISQDNDLQLWDLNMVKSVGELKGHKDQVTAVAFGPTGTWAVSASRDKTLRIWEVATGKELAKLEGHTDDVTCVAVTSQGRRIISGSRDKTLRVWKLTEVNKGSDITTEEKRPNPAPIKPEKLPGSDDNPKSKKETPAVHLLATGAEHTDAVTHLAVSRDGTKVLTHSSDKFLWFWELDAEKGKFTPAWKKRVERVQSLALDPTGSQALLGIGGNSKLSQLNTQTEEMKDRRGGRHYGAGGLFFSADGRRYLIADNYGGIYLCDWPGGEVLRTFLGHRSDLRVRPAPQICFSGDGEKILSSGDDNTVRLWNSSTADELKKLPPFSATRKRVIALSPDAKQALISQDNDLQLWDLNMVKSVGELKGHKDQVTAVAFGPAGTWAVSASRDKTLRIWEVATGKELAKLEGHDDDVTCVAVTSQGHRIVSGSRDKTLRVWKLAE
ncbi:MAG: hypothetical protein FJ271_26490 [Planctomycetes bacterium]|nr:hypothetical protein [Planctomycetota bacterium]